MKNSIIEITTSSYISI